MLKNLKLSTKLVAAFLLVGIIPFAAISWIAIKSGEGALKKKTFDQNIGLRDIKIEQIKNAMTAKRKQVQAMSEMAFTVEAMKSFKEAFAKFREENQITSVKPLKDPLFSYYSGEFQTEYKAKNSGQAPPGLRKKFEMLDNDSIALQYHYIKANKNPLGSKDQLDHPGDASTYSKIHAKFHPGLRNYLKTFAYYDIFLVDIDSGDIVYSVYKELDFSTSLLDGPFAGTNFGEAFRAAKGASDPTFVKMVDLKPYFPSYDFPAGFVASPIFDGDKKIGVLMMQIPVEQIDAIMTNNGRWKDVGMGDSGETYLVGDDHLMRSNSRFLIETPNEYFEFVKGLGMSQATIGNIQAKGTTVLNQEISTEGTQKALKGETGYSIFPDYRGVRVVSAYAKIDLPDVNWVLMSETDESEAFQAVFALKKSVGFGLFIGIIVISVVALLISRPLLKVMTNAVNALQLSSNQLLTASDQLTSSSQSLAESFTEQASNIQETSSAMEEMAAMAGENADHATSANSVVQDSRGTVDSGAESIEKMTGSMAEIKLAFEKVNKIVRAIEEIAFQTKLLSLNAALESAGAGEAGKRFSVVADEVRNLSNRAAEAAREAVQLITDANERIGSGVEIAQAVNEGFDEIHNSSLKVTGLVAEIQAASTEQAQGCDQVNRAMVQLDQATQANASTAEETSAAAETLSAQADQMREIVASLTSLIGGLHEQSSNFSSGSGNGQSYGGEHGLAKGNVVERKEKRENQAVSAGSSEEEFKQF